MRSLRRALRGAMLGVLLCSPLAAAGGDAVLRADASRLRLELPDGRVLHSAELVGAELRGTGGHAPLRIDTATAGVDANGQPLWLHELSVRDAHGQWQPLCPPHADGTRHALFVPGRERADGTIDHDDARFVVTCTSVAQGKCLRLGFRPWEPARRAPYNACIRMMRADYGGDGRAYTEAGRSIDIYDAAAILRAERQHGQRFEAGWSERGAVCVRRVRVGALATLGELQARYPRLRGRVGAICTESFARAHGALVFNRSSSAALPGNVQGRARRYR